MPNTHVFTGLDGTISVAVESGVEGDAAKAVNDAYGLTPIGRATGVTIQVASDMKPFHELGQRYATELRPGNVNITGTIGRAHVNGASPQRVVIRPLVLADVQRIQQAAQESRALTSVLMVQQALVEPKATVDEVSRMHAGLVEFLLREVNRVSGLSLAGDELEEVVRAPLARACFVLAREFGWTPDECARLTVGQVLLYLELAARGEGAWSHST
jgi:hypothetical protein